MVIPKPSLILKKNNPEYWNFIRDVRCDPRNLDGFDEKVQISDEQQKEYMKEHNDDYYVCVEYLNCIDYEIPVGFVGAVGGDIRIGVSHEYKKKDIATFMLKEFIEKTKLPYSSLYAKVLHNNKGSEGLFIKCGFTRYIGVDEILDYSKFKYFIFV